MLCQKFDVILFMNALGIFFFFFCFWEFIYEFLSNCNYQLISYKMIPTMNYVKILQKDVIGMKASFWGFLRT